MILVLDESIDRSIAEALKNAGFEVLYVLEMERGIKDEEVLEIANSNNALLLTSDKDFGDLVFRRKMIFTGVVLFRIFGISNQEKGELAVRIIKTHGNEFYNAFTVITPKTIRIRRIDSL